MKNFQFSALLLCFGCFLATCAFGQNPADAAKLAKNKTTAAAIYNILDNGNVDALDNLLAKDEVDHQLTPDMPQGLEGTKMVFKMFKSAFPDMKNRILDLVAEGDYVAIYTEFTGTHTGAFMGIPASNKPVRSRQLDLIRFNQAGQPAEHWGVSDNLTLMQQMGVAPATPPLPEIPYTAAAGQTMKTTPEQNKQLAAKFFDLFSHQDIPGDMALLAPGFQLHWNSDLKTFGAGTYKMLGETYLTAFPDAKWAPFVQIAEGDKVVSFNTYEGTMTGPLQTIPATQKKIKMVHGACLDRFENGKIAERVQINDDLDMLMQVGVIPSGK